MLYFMKGWYKEISFSIEIALGESLEASLKFCTALQNDWNQTALHLRVTDSLA